MPLSTTVTPSGDPYIDNLLIGTKWIVSPLFFSFPDSSSDYEADYFDGLPFDNFGQLLAAQQDSVREILGEISVYTLQTFQEFTFLDGDADLRFGRTDARETASGFTPGDYPEAGDVWLNNSSGIYNAPARGNYAFATLMHEIGHALGLKHGHEAPALPSDVDTLEYTVMTYRSYVGGSTVAGYSNETNGFPQTLMALDIAALQYLYGANYSSNSGNNIYRWNQSTGAFSIDGTVQGTPAANRVFMTVWDGNGTDTYDFSAWTTGVDISLMPGDYSVTSDIQKANLGDGHFARGNIWNAFMVGSDTRSLIENAIGGSGDDLLLGNDLANQLEGGGGNDVISGGLGADTMIGGTGNDVYFVDSFSDIVTELTGGGTDQVRTSIGGKTNANIYFLPNFVENFLGTATSAQGVWLNSLNNVVTMGNGADLVVLHDGGVDTVDGGGGNDYFYFGDTFTTADSVVGGTGNDTVGLLGTYNITLAANSLVGVERLAMYSAGGAPGAIPNNYSITTVDANVAAGASLIVIALSLRATETLVFNGVAETNGSFNVRGGRGNDIVTTGAGNDTLNGFLGADDLRGGAGNDIFEYYDPAHSTAAAMDEILDFSTGDKINVWVIDADGNGANGNSSFAFIGSNAFHNVAGELRAFQSGGPGAWRVEADVNGDGVADLIIAVTVTDGHLIGVSDFIL